MTRHRTGAARLICVLACATVAILLTPLTGSRTHGITAGQISVFVLGGVVVALCYLAVANQFGRDAPRPIEPVIPS